VSIQTSLLCRRNNEIKNEESIYIEGRKNKRPQWWAQYSMKAGLRQSIMLLQGRPFR